MSLLRVSTVDLLHRVEGEHGLSLKGGAQRTTDDHALPEGGARDERGRDEDVLGGRHVVARGGAQEGVAFGDDVDDALGEHSEALAQARGRQGDVDLVARAQAGDVDLLTLCGLEHVAHGEVEEDRVLHWLGALLRLGELLRELRELVLVEVSREL